MIVPPSRFHEGAEQACGQGKHDQAEAALAWQHRGKVTKTRKHALAAPNGHPQPTAVKISNWASLGPSHLSLWKSMQDGLRPNQADQASPSADAAGVWRNCHPRA